MRPAEPRDHPILFTGPMVRAILDGRKTQTRRIVRPQPEHGVDSWTFDPSSTGGWGGYLGERLMTVRGRCPYGRPGDLLWVRETWRLWESSSFNDFGEPLDPDVWTGKLADAREEWLRSRPLEFRADDIASEGPWRPSIFMPKWACRLRLRVEDVRVERLGDILYSDVRHEGIDCPEHDFDGGMCVSACPSLRDAWIRGWDAINGKRAPWSSNPWVWVVTFSRSGAPGDCI